MCIFILRKTALIDKLLLATPFLPFFTLSTMGLGCAMVLSWPLYPCSSSGRFPDDKVLFFFPPPGFPFVYFTMSPVTYWLHIVLVEMD